MPRRRWNWVKRRQPACKFTLARAEVFAGERDDARKTLEEFLTSYPHDADVPRAKAMLAALEAPGAESPKK